MSDIEQLAKEVFDTRERVKILEAMNTPVDYDARREEFVQLSLAHAAVIEAERKLDRAVYGPK